MYRLNPDLHQSFLNLFFENKKERIPEFITPLGFIIYSEENVLGDRVFLIINVSSWEMGKDFTVEASVIAEDAIHFGKFLEKPTEIWHYHDNYLGGDTIKFLKSELGELKYDEIYFVENNYSSYPQPLSHIYLLKVTDYINQVQTYFSQNPVKADGLYELSISESNDHKILKLYNGRFSDCSSCVNLRVFNSYGYGKPRTNLGENTWFNQDFGKLKDLNVLSISNNESLMPEGLEIIKDLPYLVELNLSDNQLSQLPTGLQI